MIRTHERLDAWKSAISLVKRVYQVTKSLPKEELFGLTSQMRRAAVSVPANIAEGAARGTRKEFRHFLIISRGSLSELETLLVVAREVGYEGFDDQRLNELLDTVSSLLSGLIKSLQE